MSNHFRKTEKLFKETETQKWLCDWFCQQYVTDVYWEVFGHKIIYNCPDPVAGAWQRLYNFVGACMT